MGCNSGYNGPHLARFTPKPKIQRPLMLMLFQRPWPRKFSRGCTAFHFSFASIPNLLCCPHLSGNSIFPWSSLSSHSFRIGAATTEVKAGLPPWLIQTLEGGQATALHWNFTLCSSGGFYFTSHIQDKGFGTLYKDIVPLVFLKVVVRQYLGCNLGAHLPLCVARSRLGGALTPP